MEKTIKEMCEDIWKWGTCVRPLYPCCWKLSYFGDHIYIKDKVICGVEDAED